MAFGSSPFAASPFGSSGSVVAQFEYDAPSLGNVASFGGPYSARHDSLHELASLGYAVTFGGPYAGANTYEMLSLGVVARFGNFTTPGDVAVAAESLGLVPRFGHMSAIRFIKRLTA